MEPNFKLLLDEMKSLKTSLEGSIASVNTSLGVHIDAVERTLADRLGQLEGATQVFDAWKPSVDASVKELRADVGEIRKTGETVEKMREEMTALRKSVSRVVLDSAPTTASGVLPPPVVTAASSSAGHPVIGPSVGHGESLHHRGPELSTQPPVKGMIPRLHPLPIPTGSLRKSFSSSLLNLGGSNVLSGNHTPRDARD
jgi:hypothetical protein